MMKTKQPKKRAENLKTRLLKRFETGYFPFDAKEFYLNNTKVVEKYIKKNTKKLVIDDEEVPEEILNKRNIKVLRSNMDHKRTLNTIQKLEYIKCSMDIIYFVEKYIKIIHVDKGVVPFKLYPFQKDMINMYNDNRFCVSVTARQMGKTQTTAAFITHFMLFSNSKEVAILANKQNQAKEILERIRDSYEKIPYMFKSGTKIYNKNMIKFDNGCTVGAYASDAASIRGRSIPLVYIDETAFIQNDYEFYTSTYPVLTSGKDTKLIMTSTPKGTRGIFYDTWVKSDPELSVTNGFVRKMVKWYEHPERDEEWAKDVKSKLSREQFEQEFECSFSGSVDSLLPSHVMEKLVVSEPIETGSMFRRYDMPQPNHKYFMTVDTARGLRKDYSVIHVFDVTKIPYEEVYIHQSNTISPMVYAGFVDRVGKEYNYAYVLIELNDIGESIATDLYYNYEYENVLYVHKENGTQVLGYDGPSSLLGIKTSVVTKSVGCSSIVTLIDKNKIIIKDAATIDEFGNFIVKGKSYEAASGAHDDLVMTCVIFAWATTQTFFIDNFNVDVRGEIRNDNGEIEDAYALPFGLIDNPLYDYDVVNFDATLLL